MDALIEGVIAAKKEVRNRNLNLKVGFGSVPESPAYRVFQRFIQEYSHPLHVGDTFGMT